MEQLFEHIVDITFTLADGSELLCTTTLNHEILSSYGYGEIDAFVDMSSGRIIPEDMFNFDFRIEPKGTHKLSPLDLLFQNGGKIHWTIV